MLSAGKAQSILEYAILIAIVVASMVVMQVFIKRGISGSLKKSSDSMSGGSSFSPSGTTTRDTANLTTTRKITEFTAVDSQAAKLSSSIAGIGAVDIVSKGAYSAGNSSGGEMVVTSQSRTLGASKEAFKTSELSTAVQPDFTDSDF